MKVNLSQILIVLMTVVATNSHHLLVKAQQKTNVYPPEYANNYLQDCVKTSIAEGLVEAEAKTLCNCTLEQFQQKYTLEEFKQLTAASKTDQTAADALVDVGQSCFDTILYEN